MEIKIHVFSIATEFISRQARSFGIIVDIITRIRKKHMRGAMDSQTNEKVAKILKLDMILIR